MRQTGTTPIVAWSRTFFATSDQVREARQFLTSILDGRPATDDAVLCLSELVTNACLHSHSHEPGGKYTVRAQLNDGTLKVEVSDSGGPWTWSDYPDERHGRGLLIVAQLAQAWGRTGGAHRAGLSASVASALTPAGSAVDRRPWKAGQQGAS